MFAQEDREKLAEDAFRDCIRADPTNPLYYCNRAKYYDDIGRTKEAEEDIKRAEELLQNPSINFPAENLKYITQRISFYKNMKQMENTVKTIDQNN